MNLITEYPIWLFPLCLVVGICFSALLYYKNSRNNFSKKIEILLAIIRVITVSLIVFLLLSPVFKVKTFINEKPLLIFAQDNSRSILLNRDSSFYKSTYKTKVNELLEKLSSNYLIKRLDFSDKLTEENSFSFDGKQTDISSIFYEIDNRYINRNVGAIIIASDGLYNSGNNPLYVKNQINAPVFCVAMGDTTIRKDVLIKKVNYNKITYLGNKFPVEILVNAYKCNGNNVKLSVFHNKNEVFSQNLSIKGDNFSLNIPFNLDAKEVGIQRYTIKISSVENEITDLNNLKDIFIDVIDSRKKILLLFEAPHPDISAIKQTLESNKNYQVEIYDIEQFSKNINDYNVVILHSLPSNSPASYKYISEIKKYNIPALYILGSQININQFNQLQTGINIISKGNSLNECYPYFSDEFSFFSIGEFTRKFSAMLPPLHCLYGNYQVSPSIETLIYQKIGNVVSNYPLLAYSQTIDSRYAFIAGEGIWRWRIVNYFQKDNTSIFDEIILKSIQFLSAKTDKSQFRINNNNIFFENQNVEFNAELYNDNFELINSPDIDIKITNSKGKNFDYKFAKTSNSYYLDVGILEADNYTYKAIAALKNKNLTYSGKFIVEPVDIEYTNTIANHQLLFNISEKSGGQLVYPQNVENLENIISKRDDIKTIKYEQIQYLEWTNIFWILIIIIILMGLEWFIRKYKGGY